MDVFWGPLFSRANVTSINYAPFNVSTNDKIKVIINGGDEQEIKVLTGDVASAGAATADEMIEILSRIKGATPSIVEDIQTGYEYINIRTDAPGMIGSVEIVASSMINVAKLDLTVGNYEIWKQVLRTVIYEINPNEVVIEIPSVVNILDNSLLNSHHIHATANIEAPVAPNNGVWQGSFINNAVSPYGNKTVTSQKAKTTQIIKKGNVYTSITVDDVSNLVDTSGELIFGFGTNEEEFPVKFRGVLPNDTLLIDPSYVFQYPHVVDTVVNVLSAESGTEYDIFMPSASDARTIVQTILETLSAAGIIVTFVILAEDYRFVIENPYL